ncbi:MAG: OmpP1/FadL family transporter [Candidatus Aminicenantales bacterium]
MKKSAYCAAALLLSLLIPGPHAWGNGLNLNSLGSKALSMGGAFVGLADDFSVVFWNPAGAAGFRTDYLGFYGTDLMPTSKYRLDIPSGSGTATLIDAKSKVSHYLGGMLAYYRPVSDKLVLGIGVYTPSGLGVNWSGSDFTALSNGTAYDWSSKVGAVSVSPLAAWKVNDKVSIGVALNINYGLFLMNRPAGESGDPAASGASNTIDLGQYEENMHGWGLGATLGFLVKPSERLSFGLTVRTPSTIRLKGHALISNLSLFGFSDTSDLERNIKLPLWIAGGVAVRPAARLLVTADVQWTGWGTMKTMKTDYADHAWKTIMRASGDDALKMDWSDRIQVRFGAEYALSDAFALRAGYYHDPSPSPLTTMNPLLPSYTFEGLTAGIGWKYSGLQLDFGLEYLAGKERTVDLMKTMTDPAYASAMPGKYKMTIIVPNLSIGYRF